VGGDTVCVGAGTYAETVRPDNSGSSGSLIAFIADTSGEQTGDQGDVVLTGSNARDRGFDLKDRDYIQIQGFAVTATKKEGILAENSVGVLIRSCRFYSNQDYALKLKGARGCEISDCTAYSNGKSGFYCEDLKGAGTSLLRCIAYDNGEWGIYFKVADCTSTSYVLNCMSYNNVKDGIECDAKDPTYIVNCTFASNGERGVEIKGNDDEVTLRNCIMAWNQYRGLKTSERVCNDYNLYWCNKETTSTDWSYQMDGETPGDNSFVADPLFKDRANKEYRLLAGSAAINKGYVTGAPADDVDGQARRSDDGFVDIGADECRRIIRLLSWRQVER
jgi:parallel beta-helix repeat protein